ncbi:MAG: Rrf2 family transcriptional regulator [Candidatus Methanomethylophilaceae archaeon]|nr:Rrf2 family transcriptional regulator [Candidatus Methanomethylophilaceae archaeon]
MPRWRQCPIQDSGKVKIKDISARQDISIKYLEQIVTMLTKADIVKGERGPQGGYVLSHVLLPRSQSPKWS